MIPLSRSVELGDECSLGLIGDGEEGRGDDEEAANKEDDIGLDEDGNADTEFDRDVEKDDKPDSDEEESNSGISITIRSLHDNDEELDTDASSAIGSFSEAC